jgi:aspartate aminotransferase-like enzyme
MVVGPGGWYMSVPPFGHQSLRQELLQLVVHVPATGAVAFGLFPLEQQRPHTLQEGHLFAQDQGLLQGSTEGKCLGDRQQEIAIALFEALLFSAQVDIVISAPQKGWSSSPCCALIAMSARARAKIDSTSSTSYSCDLKKWLQIMETYEGGSHVYHTTMPTDSLHVLRDVMNETRIYGFAKLKEQQIELGRQVRHLMEEKGFKSVAAAGFQAPCVVVSYTTDPEIQNGKKFMALGLQTAAGVPLQCGERPDFRSFRIGLFGLEKLQHIERTVGHLNSALANLH